MKDKKNIIIMLLIVVIIILLFLFILFPIINKKNVNNIDGSNMSSSKLIEMFNKEGYNIKLTKFYGQSGTYIILENQTEGVTIQRIVNTLIGTLMTFGDKSVNNERADLIDISRNNTKEKEQQYKIYQSWLKHYNITKTQLSDMLDYYLINNDEQTENININELLSH